MKLGLRGRFVLWFSFAALLPIAATSVTTWIVVTQSFKDGFERSSRTADETAQRELSTIERSVTNALSGIATQDMPMVDELLVDLRKGDPFSNERLAGLDRSARAIMRVGSADTLFLTLPDDTVVASPHNPGLVFDTKDPHPRSLARARPGEPVVAWAKVLPPAVPGQARTPRMILVVEAAQVVSAHDHEITVLVGREIGETFVNGLERDGLVEARLTDERGNELHSTEKGHWSALTGRVVEYPLRDAAGKPLAWLTVVVSDKELRRTQLQVGVYTGLLALLALIAAVALGFAVSRRMTRDLDAVVAGAQAVSRGDLEHVVAVKATDEIGELAGAFNAMTRELRESKERLLHAERVAAWQDIARRLAHEIKNPLTPIQMSVETLRKTFEKKHPSFEEIFHESTRTILEETARLKKIVSEFSQFARLPKPDRRACDLNEIVGGALALYRGAVKVVRELEEPLPPLEADKDQLTQVVLNLLENARDAVASRGSDQSIGRITVRTHARGELVELEVEDNGPGFTSSVRDRLFTPYFTTKESGTGLGLSIAQRIVAEHGGKMSAASDPGRGARFVVELPVSPSRASL
jgi:signal transduction histidine kinase